MGLAQLQESYHNQLLLPEDVIHECPELMTKLGYTPDKIGRLVAMNILDGVVIRHGRSSKTYVYRDSVKDLVDFINARLEKKKIKKFEFKD